MSIVLAKHWEHHGLARRQPALPNRNFRAAKIRRKQAARNSSRTQAEPQVSVFMLAIALIALGAFYLYQVNTIATKGYEIKEVESRIQELQKENQKLEIREVELKSMYNIEKSMDNLNLVSSPNVSYIELDGPVAMK